MSHYDCRHCGAIGGIGYGVCHSCTPKEVLEAKKKAKDAYQAEYERVINQYKDEAHKKAQKYSKGLHNAYQEVFTRYAPWFNQRFNGVK